MRLFCLFLLILLLPSLAQATVHIYTNPQFNYTFSYPDNWMAQTENGELPHRYRIVANEGRGSGWCEIVTSEDRRFMHYPAKYQSDLMQREFGPEFWMSYLADEAGLTFLDAKERTGLGAGNATSVIVDYTDTQRGPERAMLAGTVHDGVRYIAQCAAPQGDFAGYERIFHSIIATLKMEPAYALFPNGFYRDFTGDRPIIFPLAEGEANVAY